MTENDNLHGLNLTPPATGAAARTRQVAATGAPAPAPLRAATDGGAPRAPAPPPAPAARFPAMPGDAPIPPAGPTLQEALRDLAMWKARTEALEHTVASADVRAALQTGNPSKDAKKPVLPDVVPGHKASVLDSTRESNSFTTHVLAAYTTRLHGTMYCPHPRVTMHVPRHVYLPTRPGRTSVHTTHVPSITSPATYRFQSPRTVC